MKVITLEAGGDANLTYLILPGDCQWAWCVDPSFGARAIEAALRREGRTLANIFLTHGHPDHAAGAAVLMGRFGCPVWCHHWEAQGVSGAQVLLREGPFEGDLDAEVLFTPGHTPGSVCYRVDGHLFTGDALFVDWIGRCDLPGGSERSMFESLRRLRSLPDTLTIHPGHHYGTVASRTLGEEKRLNPYLRCTDFEKFRRILPELTS